MSEIRKEFKTYSKTVQALCNRRRIPGKLVAVTRGARYMSLNVRLADSLMLDKALKLADSLALAASVQSVRASGAGGVVVYEFELKKSLWESYTRSDLPDPKAVGLGENRKPVLFELDPPHSIFAGTTRSGKTRAMESAMVSLCQTHEPNELSLVLCDPDSQFGGFDNSAHLALPRARSSEEISNALGWAYRKMLDRKSKQFAGPKMVVVIDEVASQAVLADRKNLISIQELSALGAKWNVHSMIGTQKPSAKNLPDLLVNFTSRWVGRVDNATTSANISGHAGLEAHKLSLGGDFIHVDGPKIERLQVAMATQTDFDKLPRAEVQQVEVEPVEFVEFEKPDESAIVPEGVTPKALARFLFGGVMLGRDQAAKWGVGRADHQANKQFYRQMLCELANLIQEELKCTDLI